MNQIPEYKPEICPYARREEDHFNCTQLTFGCPQVKQQVQYICPCFGKDGFGWIPVTEETIQELINEVKRWNDCRTRVPQKDAYSLQGIKHFKIFQKSLMIKNPEHDYWGEEPKWDLEEQKRELIKLLDNGDQIEFNEDWGVGTIEKTNKGYTVTKWYYRTESKPVVDGTIDDVFNFLKEFWSINEPFSYAKAGYPELEK